MALVRQRKSRTPMASYGAEWVNRLIEGSRFVLTATVGYFAANFCYFDNFRDFLPSETDQCP